MWQAGWNPVVNQGEFIVRRYEMFYFVDTDGSSTIINVSLCTRMVGLCRSACTASSSDATVFAWEDQDQGTSYCLCRIGVEERLETLSSWNEVG